MTDTQLITICLSFVVPISLLLYSNSRITDAKETLRAELGQLRSDINLMFERLSMRIDQNHREILSEIRLHEKEHH